MSNKEIDIKTAKSFGFEWSTFKEIYDSYEDNFLSYINPIRKEFFKDKLVLDAGCGAGRHSYFASKYGARVIGIDISPKAIITARKNLSMFSCAYMICMGIYKFAEETQLRFDYVFCIGVLHHLTDPQDAFDDLVFLLKPGGTISIWVYSKKDNWLAIHIYKPLRKITTKIPHKLLYYLCYLPACLVAVCNWLRLPLFSYYRVFPFRTKLNDAFDVFSAPSARYFDIDEVQRWFKESSLKDTQVFYRMLNNKAKGIIGIGVKK